MKKIFSLILVYLVTNTFAQEQANFWYFGENAGVDFSTGSPVALSNGLLNTKEGCSSISDENGNLLFYSDGISVYTKKHELMKYTDGTLANNLEGNPSSTQSGLIVPNPEDKNIYYIFTVGTDFVGSNSGLPSNPGFNYYTIDVSKGNEGEITAGPVNLAQGRDFEWSEKVTAVQGENCNEIWIVSLVQETFYAYKVDKNGVNTTPVTSTTSFSLVDKRGYLKISPDGSKIAVADYNGGGSNGSGFSQLVLLDFDVKTGVVSNPSSNLINPQIDGAPYGIEFSQQSTKLYTATHGGGSSKIFQYDLTSSDIPNTKFLVNQKSGFRGALQLAPDGKIYATVPASYDQGTRFLDVIDNPDAEASDVVYTPDAVDLGNGRLSTQGLPPFIQSFFAPVNLVNISTGEILNNSNQVFCIGDSYTIQPEKNDPTATYTWFKDNVEIANTRTITITNDNFGSGLYKVTIQSASECKKVFTGKVQVTFEPKPVINSIPPYIQCDFDANPIDGFTVFNLASKESELVSNTNNIVIDFFELSDTSFSTPLNKANYINTTASKHSILVKVTNTVSNCYQTAELALEVNPTAPNAYSNEYICELDENASNPDAKFSIGSNNGFFNFEVKTQQIIKDSGNALSLADYKFQYYRTAQDASFQTNEIVPPYEDVLFTNNSDVFVRISNKGTNACETFGSFKIFVEKLPVPQGDLNEQILCVSNPRQTPETQTISLNADTGNPTDTYKWYLNGFEIFNETSAILKANTEGEYKVEAYRALTNSTKFCVGYNSFFVRESNKAMIVKVLTKDNLDDLNANTIQVSVTGIGDYEYSLNSTNLVDFKKGSENLSFTFSNIEPGINKVYVRDRNDCGIVSSNEISIIYFQRHFSPNEDGFMDTWNVLGVDNSFYDIVKIQIFNRYGKLVGTITDKNSPGWNGYFNGNLLPESDYWYKAELIDKTGKTLKKTGHFSLVRSN